MALFASMLVSGSMAAAEEPVESAKQSCAESAATAEAAVQLASSCGQDVEIMAERTQWDTVYATPEGNTRLDVSSTAVRTAVNGMWEPIDTSILPAGGELRVVAPAFEMAFSGGSGDQPLARIVKDGHELTFDVPLDLTVPVIDGAQVTYPQVLEGVDLVVSVHEDGTGFSEVLRVESAEAAANPALAELSFPVTTSDGLTVSGAEGGFEATDTAGERVFSSPTPLMWDSTAPLAAPSIDDVARAGARELFSDPARAEAVTGGATGAARAEAPITGDRIAEMPAEVSADAVTVIPDGGLLEHPDTVWPVYIDPSVSGGLHERMLIRAAHPDTAIGYNWPGDEGLGLCNPNEWPTCNHYGDVHRLIWEYHGLTTIGQLRGAEVVSAVFSAYGAHSFGCSPSGVEAHWAAGISSGTTWNNNGTSWTNQLDYREYAHKPDACPGNPARWVEFDVTRQLKGTADGNYSTATIALKASNESSMAIGWKRYRGDARLSVTYNRQPNVPTNLSTTDPETSCGSGADRPYIRSATPMLNANLSDPEAENVSGRWDLVRVSDGAQVGVYWSTAKAPGPASYRVPGGVLQDGVSYRWGAIAADPRGLQGGKATCEFTVDLTAPKKPAVTVSGFPDGELGGRVGDLSFVELFNGGSSDVVSYKYSFGSDALNVSRPVGADGRTTFLHIFGSTRPVTLYVQSVDRAGWTSPVRTYLIRPTALPQLGYWPLNEGSGSVAQDVPEPWTLPGLRPTPMPLTVAGSDLWTPGRGIENGQDLADHALRFDSDDDQVVSGNATVPTHETFAVSAMVRTQVVDGASRAAVSQDGQVASGFGLGIHAGTACPAETGGTCWAFWLNSSDTNAPAIAVATSSVPVTAGQWVALTGVYDASTHAAQLWVCEPNSFSLPQAGPAVDGTTFFASGSFRLGAAQSAGALSNRWRGEVNSVHAYPRVPSLDDEILRDCRSSGA